MGMWIYPLHFQQDNMLPTKTVTPMNLGVYKMETLSKFFFSIENLVRKTGPNFNS